MQRHHPYQQQSMQQQPHSETIGVLQNSDSQGLSFSNGILRQCLTFLQLNFEEFIARAKQLNLDENSIKSIVSNLVSDIYSKEDQALNNANQPHSPPQGSFNISPIKKRTVPSKKNNLSKNRKTSKIAKTYSKLYGDTYPSPLPSTSSRTPTKEKSPEFTPSWTDFSLSHIQNERKDQTWTTLSESAAPTPHDSPRDSPDPENIRRVLPTSHQAIDLDKDDNMMAAFAANFN